MTQRIRREVADLNVWGSTPGLGRYSFEFKKTIYVKDVNAYWAEDVATRQAKMKSAPKIHFMTVVLDEET